jgi:hypothetical protein
MNHPTISDDRMGPYTRIALVAIRTNGLTTHIFLCLGNFQLNDLPLISLVLSNNKMVTSVISQSISMDRIMENLDSLAEEDDDDDDVNTVKCVGVCFAEPCQWHGNE